ncbi:hypothetical protein [Nonomuraea sp. NPDC049158]|uniref:hypothetical protein n=1 Tax=Nonomuraea sp. NPDC049158 TaxID=3155649 RepID=UPI0033C33036
MGGVGWVTPPLYLWEAISTMKRFLMCCARLAAISGLVFSMVGCSMLGIGCEQAAAQDISELRKIVPPLLPETVAATLQEGNGCDSGDGGYLLFTAGITTDSGKIIDKFISKGWERIDRVKDKMGSRFIDGVTTRQHGEGINLVIDKSDDVTKMDIFVEFAS